MNILKFTPVLLLLTAFAADAQISFDLELNADPRAVCEPQNPDADNQFACCVKRARGMELDSQDTLHLRADPKLCLNPELHHLQFSLRTARPDGIRIYELSSPSIEQTPFKSFSGYPTRFWIALNSYFDFPKKVYPSNGVHSFVISPVRIEQTLPNGSVKVHFESELSTVLGWKYLNSVTLSERTERYSCANPFNPQQNCLVRIKVLEQTWLNQMTGALLKRKVEDRRELGLE